MDRKTLFKLVLSLFFSLALSPGHGQYLTSTVAAYSPDGTAELHLYDFLNADFDVSSELNAHAYNDFTDLIKKLRKQQLRYNSQSKFLKYLYYKVHRKYLRQYQTPANFSDLFQNGRYDCLTGTAFYAMIFKELGYSYEITETTYHIYLTVHVDGQAILIESTNPWEGFMDDPQTIGLMLEAYQQSNYQQSTDEYHFEEPVHQNIGLYELSGLHHYNLALKAYNNKRLSTALKHMDQALRRYPSARLFEVMTVMLRTLKQDDQVNQSEKHYYLSRYAQPLLGASNIQ